MVVSVDVELVARDANKASKRGDVIVVIDAVRATTSIITALANGAKSVTPVETVKEAKRLRRENPDFILAGERNGVKPRGFDADNSPLSLTRNVVGGRSLIMTTTNGTKALVQSKASKWVFVGAFVNADAVAQKSVVFASKNDAGVSFVLAGDKSHFALEDFLCAGAVIDKLPKDAVALSDKALGAMLAFKGAEENLQENISGSKHAQELLKIGFGKDIAFACQISLYNTVPFYQNGIIQV